ncbi:uncharacterized protein N7473_002163 [Penicillium subrubescens]|uniref:uncharacterized protein n=1 Tax=Penicillium subrubescens TaxID=1316194 RepID=UPI002544F16A|nr:uncharacterized protein N7473_002163 [Penicillium subrubescens]KAJ5905247.1 hypothetical protein N7473_002163 [Penicillium subrubescens]
MPQLPDIPRRSYARMPEQWQDTVDQKRAKSREASLSTTLSARSVSDFLEAKVQAYNCELEYFEAAHQGLHHAYNEHVISPEEFRDTMGPFLSNVKQVFEKVETISRQRKILEEDLEEFMSLKRPRHGEPSLEMLQRAYSSSLVARVMAASAKQQKKRYNQSKFKNDVNDYYGINPTNGIEDGAGYCHVLGKFDAKDIKAAHVVPKSLSVDEIAHLFGVEELVPEDPRNALSLHRALEEGLDSGKIVIVPIVEDKSKLAPPLRWKCVLTDSKCGNETLFRHRGVETKWHEIHNKELTFLNANRPARRYLYFRFIMTYIIRKKEKAESSKDFTDEVEKEEPFWPSPGPYLKKSTLVALARNISGCELPPALIEDTTFETHQEFSKVSEVNSIMLTAQSIIEAMSTSIKAAEVEGEEKTSNDEDGDEDDEEIVYESCSEYL